MQIKNPEEIRFIMSDVELFWHMYDSMGSGSKESFIFKNYIEKGSSLLKSFYSPFSECIRKLDKVLQNEFSKTYYDIVRSNTLKVEKYHQETVFGLKELKKIYADASFCHIYFVIGWLATAGKMIENHVVLGSEIFGRKSSKQDSCLNAWIRGLKPSLEMIPSAVFHEMIHFQQYQYLSRSKHAFRFDRLLDLTIIEGTADFVCSLVFGDYPNRFLAENTDQKEEEILSQFSQDLKKNKINNWFFNAKSEEIDSKLPNMGYHVGFKLVKEYYHQKKGKNQAIRDLIEASDPIQIVAETKYSHILHS